MKRTRFIGTLVALLMILGLQGRLSARGPVTTSIQAPFYATLFVPIGGGAMDRVNLLGNIRVVTQPSDPITPNDPIRIKVNLDGVMGVGVMTGGVYHATGADTVVAPFTTPLNAEFIFRLVPPDPILPTDPMSVVLNLTFNPDSGVLTGVD